MGILKTLFNIGKGKAAEADKTLKSKNAVILGKQAINALDKKIDKYEVDCGNYSATIKVQQKKLAEAEADVNDPNSTTETKHIRRDVELRVAQIPLGSDSK